jgi:hypothetical protein
MDWIRQGEEWFAQGRLDQARECFGAALKEQPQDPVALNDLAVVALAEGDAGQAEDLWRRAVAADPGYLEARVNLADALAARDAWDEAVPHLEAVHARMPDSVDLMAKLGRAYVRCGRLDDARRLGESSPVVRRTKELVDAVWTAIHYWELEGDLTTRERLEGLAGTVFLAIEGQSGPEAPFRLVTDDGQGGVQLVTGLKELFHYRYEASAKVERMRREDRDTRTDFLRVGWGPDWDLFRARLTKEIKEEGGCLGDFTQTKKVLRSEPRLQKYNLADTLEYFRANLGPCDCHVHRAVPV